MTGMIGRGVSYRMRTSKEWEGSVASMCGDLGPFLLKETFETVQNEGCGRSP